MTVDGRYCMSEAFLDSRITLLCYLVATYGGVMDAMVVMLKSRKESIKKLQAAIASLENTMATCQTAAKDVLRAEVNIKQARLVKLMAEAKALQAEIERLNPELPLTGATAPTEAKPKK